jgi:hypothetical protein
LAAAFLGAAAAFLGGILVCGCWYWIIERVLRISMMGRTRGIEVSRVFEIAW